MVAGPLFHMGWYHLFYQYNPDLAVWGNITWGHAVSRDMIHWLYLPIALVPDKWFDINGVWTGSATLLPDGKIIMLYTGMTPISMCKSRILLIPPTYPIPFSLIGSNMRVIQSWSPRPALARRISVTRAPVGLGQMENGGS